MMITLLVVAVAVVLVVVIIMIIHMHRKPSSTLYDRLGGIYKIAQLIDYFSDKVIEDPIVGKGSKNLFLRDWSQNHSDRLPGLKFMRTLWVAAATGGPYKFIPTRHNKCPLSLEGSHQQLQISPDEFDRVAQILSDSLDHFSIIGDDKNSVLAAFASHRGDINMGYFIAHAMPVVPIVC